MANSFIPLSEKVLGGKVQEFVNAITNTKFVDQVSANAEALERHLWVRLKEAKTREALMAEIENIKLRNNLKNEDVWDPKLNEPNYKPSAGDTVIPIIYLDDESLHNRKYVVSRYGMSHEYLVTHNGRIDEQFSTYSLISPEFFEGLCKLVETVKVIRAREDYEHRFDTFQGLLKHEGRTKLKQIITTLLGNAIWRKGLNSQQTDLLDEIEAVRGSFRDSLLLSLLSANLNRSLTPSQYSEGEEVVFIEKGFEFDSQFRVIGKGNLHKNTHGNWQLYLKGEKERLITYQIKLFDIKTVSNLEKQVRKAAKRCHKQLIVSLSLRLQNLRSFKT